MMGANISTAVHRVIGVAISEPLSRGEYSWQQFEFMLQDGSVHTVTAFFESGLEQMAKPQEWRIDEASLRQRRRIDDRPRQRQLDLPGFEG